MDYNSDDDYVPPIPAVTERLIDYGNYTDNDSDSDNDFIRRPQQNNHLIDDQDDELKRCIEESLKHYNENNLNNINNNEDLELQKAIEENLLANTNFEDDLTRAIRESLLTSTNVPPIIETGVSSSIPSNITGVSDFTQSVSSVPNIHRNRIANPIYDSTYDEKLLKYKNDIDELNNQYNKIVKPQTIDNTKEIKIRTELLSQFISTIRRISKIDNNSVLIQILNILEEYQNCKIDTINLKQEEYDNIFKELKNIRTNSNINDLLKKIICLEP